MSLPLDLSVKHEGRSISLKITRCKVFMASEFAGNVDLHLECNADVESIIQESLHLQDPGDGTGLEFIASGGPDDGVMLIFHSEAIALLDKVPESLSFLWCGEPMATVAPELAESVPIDTVHTLIDPLEILRQPRMETANPFCIGVQRDFLWLIPVFLVGGLGLAASFALHGVSESLLPYVRLAGGQLILLSAAIAVYAVWMPSRQVWFDRDRREVLLVESRTLHAKKKLADITRHNVDGFAHVRVCEREYAPEPGSDFNEGRTEYLVRLEGPIPFAFDDGRVHSRSDALHLATFWGERAARRFAAKLGYHAGLRILVATDW